MHRQYSLLDRLLVQIDSAMTSLCVSSKPKRLNPAASLQEPTLTQEQKRKSMGLMRVNHSGEVCAQALYQGQLLVANSELTRQMLERASLEEMDHLAWTRERIDELNGHASYLNLFWYMNSFFLGMLAGVLGDSWSLGFVEETEKQVTKHLENHLGLLPEADIKSKKIIEQMREDEIQHGQNALNAGAHELPRIAKYLMTLHAKVMTTFSYWI